MSKPAISKEPNDVKNSALPILFLLGMIVYGLVIRPYVFEQSIIPLEIVFLSSAFFAATHLWYLICIKTIARENFMHAMHFSND